MNRLTKTALLIGVLLLAASNAPAAPKASPAGKAYPQNPVFDAILESHKEAAQQRNLTDPQLVYATWFYEGTPTIAMKSVVEKSGRVYTCRDVSNWKEKDTTLSLLSCAKRSSLRDAIRSLPPSAPPSSVAPLLILSFNDGKKWVTRFYDRTKLPTAVSNVYRIIGAYVDTTP